MRVVCPYTRLHPRVAAELQAQAPRCEFIDVSGSPTAYWELFAELWERQEDFVLVEQDVLIAPGTIEGFAECPAPWCCTPVRQLHANRFRREIMELYPTLLCDLGDWERHWGRLDGYTVEALAEGGEAVCVHDQTPSEHLGVDRSEEELERRRAELSDYRWAVLWSAYVAECRAQGIAPVAEPGVERRRSMVMFESFCRKGDTLRGPRALVDDFIRYACMESCMDFGEYVQGCEKRVAA